MTNIIYDGVDDAMIAATEASIEHWEQHSVAKATPDWLDVSGDACALCQLYKHCQGCPIKQREEDAFIAENEDDEDFYGWEGCDGSPWEDASGARNTWRCNSRDPLAAAQFRDAAKDMADYLKQMLRELKASI